DKPGSLFACLKILSERGINLSKLESRPIQGQPWRYLFYVDVSIPDTPELFDAAMDELKTKTEDFHSLGIYRASL
ncbi:MAG: ACT domain-containing protein, partial [Treponema sp.]|nr:ACT domain-containing protein [Treponema sp.]